MATGCRELTATSTVSAGAPGKPAGRVAGTGHWRPSAAASPPEPTMISDGPAADPSRARASSSASVEASTTRTGSGPSWRRGRWVLPVMMAACLAWGDWLGAGRGLGHGYAVDQHRAAHHGPPLGREGRTDHCGRTGVDV